MTLANILSTICLSLLVNTSPAFRQSILVELGRKNVVENFEGKSTFRSEYPCPKVVRTYNCIAVLVRHQDKIINSSILGHKWTQDRFSTFSCF